MDISSMSKRERQKWINELNKCMKVYDEDIEYRMKKADEAEWEAIRKKIQCTDQKLIHIRKQNRENEEREER